MEVNMRIVLAALLATMIVAPSMAKDAGSDEDKTPADVQTPGVTEPRLPDTLKSAPDQRIRSEGRASERGTDERPPVVIERPPAVEERR
jgi:hypothetical protein